MPWVTFHETGAGLGALDGDLFEEGVGSVGLLCLGSAGPLALARGSRARGP